MLTISDKTIYIPLAFILITAVINDLRARRIPNMLTYPAMLAGIIYNSWLNGFDGLLFSIEGIMLGMAVLIIFYFMGGMGAGDVKLLGAIGGFLGPKGVFIAFLFTAVAGGVHSLLVLFFKGHIKEAITNYWLMMKTFILTRKFIYVPSSKKIRNLRLCYGISIAIGTTVSVLLETNISKILLIGGM